MIIVSAPWIVPMDQPVIRDGSIAISNRRIIDVGRRSDIISKFSGIAEHRYPCVLMPGLVNVHMHLELSHLTNSPQPAPGTPFTEWISALIQRRSENVYTRDEIVDCFNGAISDQYESGVGLIGDIGNERFERLDRRLSESGRLEIVRMLELIAPNKTVCDSVTASLDELGEENCVTVHAPYSTIPELIGTVKKRCNKFDHPFSIHTAESVEEIEFIRHGSGCFRNFLESRDSWDHSFEAQPLLDGSVEYLDSLGVLDRKTILVHCVHVTDAELDLVKKRGSHICLCPGSNQFLGVGRPRLDKIIEFGILPAIGTDSPCSNSTLDIWREMGILKNWYPAVKSQNILAMASLGGARALGRDGDLGSVSVGKMANLLSVSSDELQGCKSDTELLDTLVAGNRPEKINWLSVEQLIDPSLKGKSV